MSATAHSAGGGGEPLLALRGISKRFGALGRRAGAFDIGETSQEQVVAAITGAEFGREAAR